jgi:hypothetical protein
MEEKWGEMWAFLHVLKLYIGVHVTIFTIDIAG